MSSLLPQPNQQGKKLVDINFRAEVVAGMGVLLVADAHRNDVATQGECILVVVVVAQVKHPVTLQAIPLSGQGVAFIRRMLRRHIDHQLAAVETTSLSF